MKITPDDPKLTAYALGELDPAERAAIEAELKKSPECRRAVEEIRETALLLEKKLAAEELPGLAFAQQRKIENKLKQSADRPGLSWWRIIFYGGLSAAAACLIVTIFLPPVSKSKSKVPNLALNSPPQIKKEIPPAAPAVTVAPTPAPTEAKLKNLAETTPAKASDSRVPTPSMDTDIHQIVVVPISASTVVNANSATIAPALTPAGGTPQPTSVDNLSSASIALSPPQRDQNVLILNGANTSSGGLSRGGGGGGGFGGGGDGRGNGANYSMLQSRVAANNPSYISANNNRTSADAEVSAPGDIPVQDRFNRSMDGTQTDTATYPHLVENSFLTALNHPLSTFSIDVDTASYANVRRFLNAGQLPPHDAVRVEEMVNYFKYNYAPPRGEDPFAANIEIAGCPWNTEHRLVRIGLKGREIAQDKRPPSNFVFLIDVSGSMQPPERLPLIKQALRQLVKKMTENDRVAIVVYASGVGIKLESTPCTQKEKILAAIDELGAGGSTDGSDGIQAAYRVAQENFIEGGVNRVLLCTDGDFNVGITDQSQLVKMIQEKARGGVSLTTLGVGTDNYKDALMQKLADKGNGNYFYLDSLEEAQKVLIDQMSGTLVTIAKDVKIQVEFNPAQVGAYRLIGYEKRMLRKEDFNNDKKDAGEIGAGHTVTALYEIVPAGGEIRSGEVDDLKYQHPADEKPERYVSDSSKELLTLKLRYKQPDGDTSKLLEFPITDNGRSFGRASSDFKFATAVAEFGMMLRDSEFKGNSSYGAILELAQAAKGTDAEGYRSEFLNLVRKAQELQR